MRQSELITDIINGIAETEKEGTEQAKIAEDVVEVLEGVQGLTRKSIPGGRETFQVVEGSTSLCEEQSAW
jgi:hypothetical protein